MFDRIKELFFGDETSPTSAYAIENRVKGEQAPLSVGTAMIFEAEQADPSKWTDVVLINIMTLARNVLSSVQPEYKSDILVGDLYNAILEEMNLLYTLIPEYNPKCTVDFYYPDYSGIYSEFSKATPRNVKTKKQEFEALIYQKLFKRFEEARKDKDNPLDYRASGVKLSSDRRETTILTHVPSDLLSQYQFPKLLLLESHTGRVKSRREWNTKLNKSHGEDVSHIPFMKFTLQIYGDGIFFLVASPKIKRLIKEMAESDNWTSMTSESRVRMSINKLKHPEDRRILLSYM